MLKRRRFRYRDVLVINIGVQQLQLLEIVFRDACPADGVVANSVLCTAVLPHCHAAAAQFGNHLAFQPLHFCVKRFNPRFYLLLLLL